MAAVERGTKIVHHLELQGNLSDELLAVAYFRMLDEGLLGPIFWDYYPTVKLLPFIEWHRKITYLGCFARPCLMLDDPQGAEEFAGLGWISQIKEVNGYRRGEVGMVFWKKWHKIRGEHSTVPIEFTERLLDFCFDTEGANLDYVWGVSPEPNTGPIRFARRLGFEQVTVPGYVLWYGQPAAGVISSLTREDWNRRRSA